jgi:hypothetical protein
VADLDFGRRDSDIGSHVAPLPLTRLNGIENTSMIAETHTRKPEAEELESDIPVLFFEPDTAEPLWLGCLGGEIWCYVDCIPTATTYRTNRDRHLPCFAYRWAIGHDR